MGHVVGGTTGHGNRTGLRRISRALARVGLIALAFAATPSFAFDEQDLVGTWLDDKDREYSIVSDAEGRLGVGVPSTIPLKPKEATYCIRVYVGKFVNGKMLLTCYPEDISEMNETIPANIRQQMIDNYYQWRLELVPVQAAGKQLELKLSLFNPQITATESGTGNARKYSLVKDKTKYVSVSSQRLRRGTLVYKINCYPEKCGR